MAIHICNLPGKPMRVFCRWYVVGYDWQYLGPISQSFYDFINQFMVGNVLLLYIMRKIIIQPSHNFTHSMTA